ncbi:MAG: c-type cytochrome [Cyclobacteriaceae bacterium]
MNHKLSTASLLIALIFLSFFSCKESKPTDGPIENRVTVGDITIPEGFKLEELYKPGEHEQGSWVSITKDDKGRFYTSDQYGNIYLVDVIINDSGDASVEVQKLDLEIGLAHGLLWHKGELFALVNSSDEFVPAFSGFYKIIDSNNDGDLDSVRLMKKFIGRGEHGPHNIELSPDKKSLYLVMGNYTKKPEDLKSVIPKVWGEDNLLPVIKDPSGHANSIKAPGGWLVKTDFEGTEYTIVNVGMRNTYDIAFNQDGELFGFDSDMEYDLGMPWYRPIRLLHLTQGGDFGWRTGTGKFSVDYPDNLPALVNIGQGSPTGLMSGKGLKFPEYYQKGLYLYDWSYGTMYYASLTPKGSSYTAQTTEFLSGVPLPLTNGIAGDDGALYFATGGRRLESALYRLSYVGERPSEIITLEENTQGKEERALRNKLESLQSQDGAKELDFIIDHLDHEDRQTRFSARVALENQDINLWKDKINDENSIQAQIEFSLAITHHGDDSDRSMALDKILNLKLGDLSELQKIGVVRAIDLILIRNESEVSDAQKSKIVDLLLPAYLKSSESLNKELCKTLSFLQVSDIIAPTLEKMENDTTVSEETKALYLTDNVSQRSERYGKTVQKMLSNMPNQQNISYAKSLSVIESGWTPELRERYFKWYNRALNRSGGRTYGQFIRRIQEVALSNVPAEDRLYFESLASESMSDLGDIMAGVTQPKGPGKNWTVSEVKTAYSKNVINANFENGQNFFKATLCVSCHNINGVGKNTGPDLTQVGTRFSIEDLADAIINPSSAIPDRFGYTEHYLEDGRVVTGKKVEETEREFIISTNAFSTDLTTSVRKDKVVKEVTSTLSPMPPALINRLNEQELTDLLAFLVSGGDKDHKIFKK